MPRRFDPGYDFRSAESLRLRDGQQDKAGEGKRECALGAWCHAATRDDEGTWHPARTFQGFCPACRGVIAGRLEDLPGACVLMLTQIGQRPKTGTAVRVPAGPREPIRLDVDALAREMAHVLGSWHERVAAVARLAPPRGAGAVQHPARVTADAVTVLAAHLDVLLALPAEPMVRTFYRPADAEARTGDTGQAQPWSAPGEDGRVLASGEAYLLPSLGGVAAGREILDLHYRARKVTGQVRARPESFDGVPCRSCEAMSLERAEPPSDPSRPADHSRCAECGDTMGKDTFDAWVSHYHGWASAAGLTCRRCQDGRHRECQWAACRCAAAGHAGAAA